MSETERKIKDWERDASEIEKWWTKCVGLSIWSCFETHLVSLQNHLIWSYLFEFFLLFFVFSVGLDLCSRSRFLVFARFQLFFFFKTSAWCIVRVPWTVHQDIWTVKKEWTVIFHPFKNYFVTMFSVFNKISCIQIDH